MKDILNDQNDDVDISSGDFIYKENSNQHKRDILTASPGDYKEFPLVGVSAISYLLDNDINGLIRKTSAQMRKDGILNPIVSLDGEDIVINGEYEKN